MDKEGCYSYKELKDNKVKYNNMSACEQTNYMNGLHDESMGLLIFIIMGVTITFVILYFLSLLIFMGVL